MASKPKWDGNSGRPINSVKNLQKRLTREARRKAEEAKEAALVVL